MQRSLPIPSASRASPRNRRHYPPQLGSTHRRRSQHRPQSSGSLANLMTPGVSKSLTRSAEAGSGIAGLKAVLDRLRDERSALFLAGGSKPKLNQLITRLTELRKEARRRTVSP